MTSANVAEAIVRRFIGEVLAAGQPDAIDELVAPDFVSHTWGITEDGATHLKAVAQRVHDSLTDVEFSIDDLIGQDDRVSVRLTASASPPGEFMGVADAAGKRYTIGEMHWFRVRDGRIVEHWHQYDALGLRRQLESSVP